MKEKIRAWWRRNDAEVFYMMRCFWMITTCAMTIGVLLFGVAILGALDHLPEAELVEINTWGWITVGMDVCMFCAFFACDRAEARCDDRRRSQQAAERQTQCSSNVEAERQASVMPQPKSSRYSTAEQYRAEYYAKEAQDGISKIQDAIREVQTWDSVTDVKLKQLEQCVDRIEQSIRETRFLQIENLTLKNQKAMLEDTNSDLRRQIIELQESKYQKLQRKYDTLLDKTRGQSVPADTSKGGPHGT